MDQEHFQGHIRTQLQASAEGIMALQQQIAVIERGAALLIDTLRRGGAVLTAGNGGSAAEAMHMAEELTGRFRGNRRSLPGIALNADGTLLTCVGNDFGFDAIFARQIEGLGRAGDLLVLFSTSGQAENLLQALREARKKQMLVVG
ncbi:MAG: SIS domain-containing protein, partial [Kiritimatiellia bacterium]